MARARSRARKGRRLAALVFSLNGRLRVLAWGQGLRLFAGLRLPWRRRRPRDERQGR